MISDAFGALKLLAIVVRFFFKCMLKFTAARLRSFCTHLLSTTCYSQSALIINLGALIFPFMQCIIELFMNVNFLQSC